MIKSIENSNILIILNNGDEIKIHRCFIEGSNRDIAKQWRLYLSEEKKKIILNDISNLRGKNKKLISEEKSIQKKLNESQNLLHFNESRLKNINKHLLKKQ